MPIPVYLICAESGAIDENTKLISFFNVVEKLQFVRVETAPGQITVVSTVPLRLSAYWMREEIDDLETDFEVHFVGIFPNAPAEIDLARGQFRFTGPLQRLNVAGLQFTQFFGPGVLRLEARIRRFGEDVWLNRMSYPIILEEVQVAIPAADLPAAPQQPPA